MKRRQIGIGIGDAAARAADIAGRNAGLALGAAVLVLLASAFAMTQTRGAAHVWELQEIRLEGDGQYANPYSDVTCWVDLTGPGFAKRVYGFWDGGHTFRVRVVATAPGKWSWRSGSNQPGDRGLNGRSGSFVAQKWTEAELEENPLRRGFLRATSDGHSLQHADGTPFFLVGDTWLAASTWRLPLIGITPDPNYEPSPGITFEEAVAYRKRQGYNSISFISAFPNWSSDHYPSYHRDSKGVTMRGGWEKFGMLVEGKQPTIKDMHDERGYRAFETLPNREGLSNFDRIVPEYFRSLDKKLRYLNDNGFIAMIETVRRDITMAWHVYFDFHESYARFVQYVASRYGAFNIIYSKLHLDAIPRQASLTAEQFNAALNHHFDKFGPMPFGQPVTTLIAGSTYNRFGHGAQCPWLTLHSVGNNPRNHGSAPNIEVMFDLNPPYPVINLEPYYTGWYGGGNTPMGERAPVNSDRDNYFARAQMYGSVLSGALPGHVHGHAAYDITTTGEPAGERPFIWDALRYTSGGQMRHLRNFVLSEGSRYQQLRLGSKEITPKRAPGSPDLGLDGWSYMMRTEQKDFALLYFEHKASRATLTSFRPDAAYAFSWYDPRAGEWLPLSTLRSDASGTIRLPAFPDSEQEAKLDWAAKLLLGQ